MSFGWSLRDINFFAEIRNNPILSLMRGDEEKYTADIAETVFYWSCAKCDMTKQMKSH